jgi:hypothetical protein
MHWTSMGSIRCLGLVVQKVDFVAFSFRPQCSAQSNVKTSIEIKLICVMTQFYVVSEEQQAGSVGFKGEHSLQSLF